MDGPGDTVEGCPWSRLEWGNSRAASPAAERSGHALRPGKGSAKPVALHTVPGPPYHPYRRVPPEAQRGPWEGGSVSLQLGRSRPSSAEQQPCFCGRTPPGGAQTWERETAARAWRLGSHLPGRAGLHLCRGMGAPIRHPASGPLPVGTTVCPLPFFPQDSRWHSPTGRQLAQAWDGPHANREGCELQWPCSSD